MPEDDTQYRPTPASPLSEWVVQFCWPTSNELTETNWTDDRNYWQDHGGAQQYLKDCRDAEVSEFDDPEDRMKFRLLHRVTVVAVRG